MSGLPDLFALSKAYATAASLSESTVSERVLKGGNRLRDLRAGTADIGVRRLATAIQWFSDNWPESLPWPDDIERPDPTTATAETAA